MIEVYIGEEPHDWLFAEVLRYSLVKRSKSSLIIHILKHLPVKVPIRNMNGASLYRFYVPSLNQFKEKVLYIHQSTLVRMDVAELMKNDMQGKGALAPEGKNLDVMLLDTPRLKHWDGDQISLKCEDRDLMKKTLLALPEGLVTEDIGALYFKEGELVFPSDLFSSNATFLHPLFLEDLKSALKDHEIDPASLEREVQKGKLPPDLFKILEA